MKYMKPHMEVISVDVEDVIRTSVIDPGLDGTGGTTGDGTGNDGGSTGTGGMFPRT